MHLASERDRVDTPSTRSRIWGFDRTYGDRVEFKYYESGHMAYLNPASAKQLKTDIAHFIESTEHLSPLETPAAER